MDEEIAELQQTSKNMDPLVKSSQELQRKVKDIDAWHRNDILWLDELERLSKDMPSNRDAQLTHLRLAPHLQGGELHMEGIVSATQVLDDLEKRLRDSSHVVEGKGRGHETKTPKYPWWFHTNVIVKHESESPKPVAAAPKPAVPSTSAAPVPKPNAGGE